MDPFLRLGADELECVGGWLDFRSVIAWAAVNTSMRQMFAWHAACARARPGLLHLQRDRHLCSHSQAYVLVVRALLVLCDSNRVRDLRDEVEAQTRRGSSILVAWARPSPFMQLRRFVQVAKIAGFDWCMAVLMRLQFLCGWKLNPVLNTNFVT